MVLTPWMAPQDLMPPLAWRGGRAGHPAQTLGSAQACQGWHGQQEQKEEVLSGLDR